MTLVVMSIILPFLAALQNFSIEYGYKGFTKKAALRNSWYVFLAMSIIIAIGWLFYK